MTHIPDTIPSTGNLFRALPDAPRQACRSTESIYNAHRIDFTHLLYETKMLQFLDATPLSIVMVQIVSTKPFDLHFYSRQVSVFPPVWGVPRIDTFSIFSYTECAVKYYWRLLIHLFHPLHLRYSIITDGIVAARYSSRLQPLGAVWSGTSTRSKLNKTSSRSFFSK